MTRDVIGDAIAEAERRAAISDRDQTRSVAHFAGSIRPVIAQWDLTAEARLDGGAGTPTLAVTMPDGTSAVLKLAEPGELDAAVRVMRAAAGVGYARVLAWDAEVGALLTERLGHELWTAASTLDEQCPIVGSLLLDAWRVPLDRGTPFTGKAARLLEILAELGPRYGTGHAAAIERASRYALELAATERPQVVCHGDAHAGNVLRRRDGWALIDPDGFVGERSYDIGVVLRDGCRELVAAEAAVPGSGATLLRSSCRQLADIASVDADRVWGWAFVERVTTGLYLAWHGYADEASSFLDCADMLAE